MIHELDDFLAENPPITVTVAVGYDAPERFQIADDSSAAWAMRKLRQLRRRQKDNINLADIEYQRISEWVDSVNKPLEDNATFFEGLLTEYAIDCRQNPEDERKTISLPSGKVTTRQNPPKWTVEAEAFLPWAREHRPDLIRVKEEPALSAIKDAYKEGPSVASTGVAITDDGEVVPGIAIAETTTTVTVNPDLD